LKRGLDQSRVRERREGGQGDEWGQAESDEALHMSAPQYFARVSRPSESCLTPDRSQHRAKLHGLGRVNNRGARLTPCC